MSQHRFTQVDVFTDRALLGNPLAVVHDADGLDDAHRQAFARWTHLSETTFLLAPTEAEADYRVRIFTPDRELPFAGHPTLGSAHAWLEAGGVPKRAGELVQQCAVGLVRVRVEPAARGGGRRLAFAAPPLAVEPVHPALLDAVIGALRLPREKVIDAQWLVNGPRWLTLLLDAATTVQSIVPDAAAMAALDHVGVVGAHPAGGAVAFEVRGFVGGTQPFEDPVTGSLNAGIAEWLIGSGRAPDRYVAAQGAALGRAGRVHVRREGGTLWIGGDCTTVVRGEVSP